MLKRTLLAALVLGAASTAVQAQEPSGYLSGNIGQSDAKGFRSNTDTGYKIAVGLQANCRVPDDQMSFRSYPLLVARELIQKVFREHTHEHQAT